MLNALESRASTSQDVETERKVLAGTNPAANLLGVGGSLLDQMVLNTPFGCYCFDSMSQPISHCVPGPCWHGGRTGDKIDVASVL